MKVLVTGAAGFLGSHLCDALLSRGDEVIGLDDMSTGYRENLPEHPRFEFVHHDVCGRFHVQCDLLMHMACPASPKAYQRNGVRTIETAVLGTRNALECARNANARIVIASTSECYGDPTISPQPETYWGNVNPVGARSMYDEGKRCAEAMCVAWSNQYGTDVRIARIFNTYGPRLAAGDGRVISNFIVQALRGDRLTVYGDGSQTRSFCYVDDMVAGLMALSEKKSQRFRGVELFNLGNPDERSVLSVAQDVLRAVGRDAGDIDFRPIPQDDPKRRCPDIMSARAMLRWEPTVSYADGIARTVSWFRDRLGKREAA